MKTKSWKECLDEVAKKEGCQLPIAKFKKQKMFKVTEEASQLFQEEGIREAVRMAREGSYRIDEWIYLYTEQEIVDQLIPNK